MNLSAQIAKNLHDVHFGGNWTVSNVKDQLADVTWTEATRKVGSLNTIAALAFHINYFVEVTIPVLQGGELDAHDKYSYDVPDIQSEDEWQQLRSKVLSDAEKLIDLVEQLPLEQWDENFVLEKYGNYYRNMHGIVEHTHYHLGQISLIKKMIRSSQG